MKTPEDLTGMRSGRLTVKARREAEIRLFGNYQIEVSELNGEIKKSDVIAVLNWMMEHGFSSYTVAEVLGGLVSEEKRNDHE